MVVTAGHLKLRPGMPRCLMAGAPGAPAALPGLATCAPRPKKADAGGAAPAAAAEPRDRR